MWCLCIGKAFCFMLYWLSIFLHLVNEIQAFDRTHGIFELYAYFYPKMLQLCLLNVKMYAVLKYMITVVLY